MKLVCTQEGIADELIMGMTQEAAQQRMAQLFGQMSAASQAFMLGMAMDLAAEDPRPKKQRRPRGAATGALQLVVG